MRVLFVAHERNLGGASKSLVTLASELKEDGNEISVVIPFKSGQVYRELKQRQIPVHRIFFGWWMMPSDWNLFFRAAFRGLYLTEKIAAARIASLAKKQRVQVIHSNSSAIDVGAIAAGKAGLPHVWHFREFGDLDYRLDYLKGREKSCGFVREVPGKVVFISKNLRQYYEKEIPNNKCLVIYNGISEQFLNDKYGAAGNRDLRIERNRPVVFLISGNLHRNKRQDIAIEACRILYERGHRDFRLVVAGAASGMADSREYERQLQKKAEEQLSGMVEFTGYVTDMKALRERTDVELVCSSREAFGRVTVEAMMSSNPVIGSDTGANPELIEPGRNGLLFREGDAGELAERMLVYMDHPELIRTMGAYAYTYAAGRFPSSTNTKRVESLYRELIENK